MNSPGGQSVLESVRQLEITGHFKEAASALTNALSNASLTAGDRSQLLFEADRLERIRKDFPLTRDELFGELKKAVKDLTASEFDQWIAEGRFDSREIDGRQYFMSSSVSNLFFRYPELNPRRRPPKLTAELEATYLKNAETIRSAAEAARTSYVLPKRFHVTMTVTANAGAAPAGQNIQAWLPIPRAYPFQKDCEFLSASSKPREIDDISSPIRAICLEQPAKKGKPTVFTAEYNYTISGVWFGIRPENTRPADLADPELKKFTSEAPHVVFTPEIKALSTEITGNETNPGVKARKFYDWISTHIQYSYAIEYSTIRNISDYCRARGYGDCGQESLLFITFCRLNGIPARWQSGWNLVPGGKTIHDWSEIYLEPYGWVPVDPYMGIFAMRYANSLTTEQKSRLRDFYFGGLDWYRMAANGDHSQTLSPAKTAPRSDDVDFQRGELESEGRNIYFDQYSWDLKYKEVPIHRVD
jgi:transglutaminase-like putative cysteine protease